MLHSLPSREDDLLDAVLDEFTAHPRIGLVAVLARVEGARVAESKVVRVGRRQAEQREELAAQLCVDWAAVIGAHAPASADDELVTRTAVYLEELAHTAERDGTAPLRAGAYSPSSSPPPPSSPAALAARALSPLTAALAHSACTDDDDDAARSLRCAYVHLLPSLASLLVPRSPRAASATASVMSLYAQHTVDGAVRDLLSPYTAAAVAPLERELRYHFSAGRSTAAAHEPQHFFAFLLDCFARQRSVAAALWSEAAAAAVTSPHGGSGGSSSAALHTLQSVGAVLLSATAAAVFQDGYGWHAASPLRHHREYVVVTVNAVLDFLAAAEGRLCSEALQVLARHLLADDVLHVYTAAACDVATAALHDGATRLWRRAFLMEGDRCASHPLYTRSLHLVRSLEAFQRRLQNSLLLVNGAWAGLVWRRTVVPALSVFLGEVEAQVPPVEGDATATASWDRVLSMQWCVASVQVVTAAAEDWLGMLRESTAAAPAHDALSQSEVVDGLTLFRDQLTRRAAEEARVLAKQLCTQGAVWLLHGAEDVLQRMEALPDGTAARYVVQDRLRSTLHGCLTRDARVELVSYATRSGLRRVAQLLTA
ncbi:hypothetical protein NESM_000399700 [Novymonas esmeraldas]|uniref:Uncharacterized protein n=1 Tax=Novymonas esmeraldas TaxID=1808958 RepID=A0AAW0EPK4_9TRYP